MNAQTKQFFEETRIHDKEISFLLSRLYYRPSIVKEIYEDSEEFKMLFLSSTFLFFLQHVLIEEKEEIRYNKKDLEKFKSWVLYFIRFKRDCQNQFFLTEMERKKLEHFSIEHARQVLDEIRIELDIRRCIEKEKIKDAKTLFSYLVKYHSEEEFTLQDRDYELLCSPLFLKFVKELKEENLSIEIEKAILNLLEMSIEIKENPSIYPYYVERIGEKRLREFSLTLAQNLYLKYMALYSRKKRPRKKTKFMILEGKISKVDV